MSAQWMLYALAVGALVTLAALAAEQGTRLARRAGRWVWALALLLTVALPLLALGGARPVADSAASAPSLPAPALSPTLVIGGFPATPSLTPPAWLPAQSTASGFIDIDAAKWVAWAWPLSSIAVLAWLLASALALRRRQRGWHPVIFGGATVLVSDDAGPAVTGVLRPRIVIPRWLMTASPARQAAVLAHEQSHIDAGDQRLLACAWLLAAAMPWLAPLWYQLHRLRRAIEVDCDARVLASGLPLAEYGAALIDIGAHPPAPSRLPAFAAPAMAEAPGFLEQRVRLMLRRPARWHKVVAPLLLLLSVDIGVAAARITPPAVAATSDAEASAPAVDRAALAGYYMVGPNRVAVVSTTADGLAMKTNLEPGWPLLPDGPDSYFLPGSSLHVRFDRRAGTLTIHQMGADAAPSPRVDAAAVERADAYIAARIASGQPLAGGQQIVQRNVNAREPAQLHAADFTPELLTRAGLMLPQMRKRLEGFGTPVEVSFDGVTRYGWDAYKVRYVNGAQSRTLRWYIWLDANGKLANATADLGPL